MSFDKSFFGHPKGLATLFFTEMWERLSFYGMRGLLFLFMVGTVETGGMGLDEKTSGAIYGLYTMLVYLLALPGGWLADRFFGLRNAVFYGGCIITVGHLCLAMPFVETFFLGLFLITIGTGFLKPNVSSLVGELYPSHEQARRDSGFYIFFMGINLGGFLGPLIISYLGENIDWHYGFAAAGVGMFIGVIQYKLTESNLGNAGKEPSKLPDHVAQASREKGIRKTLWIIVAALTILVVMLMAKIITIDPVVLARGSAYVLGSGALLYFMYVFAFENLTKDEKQKVGVILVFFLATLAFYAGYEGQGSSLTLFAERYTDRIAFGKEFPAGWFISVSSAFVLIFVPVFAWLWLRLDRVNLNPSTTIKMALGLILMGLGYAAMMTASYFVIGGSKVSPMWLVLTYLLHTLGEICLYPIGLSAVTKLAPQRLVGQMMGVFFMALAFGNLSAGIFAGNFDDTAIAADTQVMINLFKVVAVAMLLVGGIVILLNKPLKKWMGEIK
ncbi:MAG TPA: oligopeptide:H+ symporter [Chryseosolibacter sp.]